MTSPRFSVQLPAQGLEESLPGLFAGQPFEPTVLRGEHGPIAQPGVEALFQKPVAVAQLAGDLAEHQLRQGVLALGTQVEAGLQKALRHLHNPKYRHARWGSAMTQVSLERKT